MANNSNTDANQVPSGGPKGVPVSIPQVKIACEKCEGRLTLGVFFDGTGNNRDVNLPTKSHSNVSRLYAAYPDDLMLGYGRVYIEGVGTPMKAIADTGGATGSAFSAGGEARILFGVLSVFNAVDNWLRGNSRVNPGNFFSPQQMRVLCTQSELVTTYVHGVPLKSINQADLAILKTVLPPALKMEEKGGLLHDWPGRNKYRHGFFAAQLERIADRMDKTQTPVLKEIIIDVFGFSRGAAQARAFCNHLYTLADKGKLFGVSFNVRFLGVFDTVASVGVQGGALGYTTGHMNWADPDVAGGVTIHPDIHHYEHFFSMHENRGSFPLDKATAKGGTAATNGRQWAFPGSHSDVGGGYAPGDQGKSPDDKNKLSQIPLEYMYNAARDAGVPLDKTRALAPAAGAEGGDGYDSFEVGEPLRTAFSAFLAASPKSATTHDFLLPYLVYWYRHLNDYQTLSFYKQASADDKSVIDRVQNSYRDDIAKVKGTTPASKLKYLSPIWGVIAAREKVSEYLWIDSEIVPKLDAYPALSAALEDLFGNYAHDSLAGFVKDIYMVEITGRIHWRRIFYGTETAKLAAAEPKVSPTSSSLA